MSEAQDHVEHCDVLITGCLATIEGSRALGLAVTLDEDLTALDLMATAKALSILTNRIYAMAQELAEAN